MKFDTPYDPRFRDLMIDYFRWRNEDAHRNALNAHCYWMMRKNEYLFQNGINFNDIPNWQKRGIGFYWEEYEKPSINPITGDEAMAIRRRL